MSRLAPLSVIAVVSAALLSGCGSSNSSSTSSSAPAGSATSASASATATAPAAAGLMLTESEFKITPASTRIAKPGKTTITVVNSGKVVHAFEIQGPGGEQKTGTIAPGATATVTVDLRQGSYTFYCPIDGHRQLGMHGGLVVGHAAAAPSGGAAPPTTTSTSTTSSTSRYGY
jgi:uncharacterized cupredoxin-like copper-binding protein